MLRPLAPEDAQELTTVRGLEQEVGRASAHRFDGERDVALAGEDDDG